MGQGLYAWELGGGGFLHSDADVPPTVAGHVAPTKRPAMRRGIGESGGEHGSQRWHLGGLCQVPRAHGHAALGDGKAGGIFASPIELSISDI